MPQVVLWLGNEKKVVDVQDPVPEYIYMYPEPDPPTYVGSGVFDYTETVRKLRYRVVECRDHKGRFVGYQGHLVE